MGIFLRCNNKHRRRIFTTVLPSSKHTYRSMRPRHYLKFSLRKDIYHIQIIKISTELRELITSFCLVSHWTTETTNQFTPKQQTIFFRNQLLVFSALKSLYCWRQLGSRQSWAEKFGVEMFGKL